MNRLKELEKQELLIREEKNKILEKEKQEIHIPELKKYIGRFFKYPKNCYSCPEKKSDYWDDYYRILDFVNDTFIVENCYVDSNGKAVIQIETKFEYGDGRKPFPYWKEIKQKEYENAKTKTWLELYTQEKMRKILSEDK
jgi:hypothetical protein